MIRYIGIIGEGLMLGAQFNFYIIGILAGFKYLFGGL
jgi:hypothetical protein